MTKLPSSVFSAVTQWLNWSAGTASIRLPAIVITADRTVKLEDEVRSRGYGLLRKPIKPAALRALITNTVKNLL